MIIIFTLLKEFLFNYIYFCSNNKCVCKSGYVEIVGNGKDCKAYAISQTCDSNNKCFYKKFKCIN